MFEIRCSINPQTPNHELRVFLVGLGGLEPPTSRLSGVRSNQLSYKPIKLVTQNQTTRFKLTRLTLKSVRLPRLTSRIDLGVCSAFRQTFLLRKEVIQPHLPIRLPCYDFTPIIYPTFDGWLLSVTSPASGVADFRGVTGGVYKARERIHRSVLTCDY